MEFDEALHLRGEDDQDDVNEVERATFGEEHDLTRVAGDEDEATGGEGKNR
jgi:hypothetical protein